MQTFGRAPWLGIEAASSRRWLRRSPFFVTGEAVPNGHVVSRVNPARDPLRGASGSGLAGCGLFPASLLDKRAREACSPNQLAAGAATSAPGPAGFG
jgi:hypothetical protein